MQDKIFVVHMLDELFDDTWLCLQPGIADGVGHIVVRTDICPDGEE